MGALDNLIYGLRDVFNGTTQLARKAKIQFRNGLTAQVIDDQIVVDADGGGSGGAAPSGTGWPHVTDGAWDDPILAKIPLSALDPTGSNDGDIPTANAGIVAWAPPTQQPPVDPLSLSPYESWSSNNLTLAGSVVTNWPANSGTSARDFASVGADPEVVTDGAGGGHPYVHFNSTALQQATAATWNFLHDGTTDWTVWMVVRVRAAGDNYILRSNGGSGGHPGAAFWINGTDGAFYQLMSESGLSVPLFEAQRTRKGLLNQTSPCVITIRHKVGEGLRVHINGLEYLADATFGAYNTSNAHEKLWLGLSVIDVWELGVFKTAKSLSTLEAIENSLGKKYGVPIARYAHATLNWDGNSLFSPIFTPAIPDNVLPLLKVDIPVIERMYGISGQSTTMMIARGPSRIDAFFDTKAALNIVVGQEIVNDIALGASVSQAIANMKTWCAARKAAGFIVVLGEVTPCALSEADLNTVRDALRDGEGKWFDALARLRDDPDIGPYGVNVAGVLFTDAIHFTEKGDHVRAPAFAQAIRKAIALHLSQDNITAIEIEVDDETKYITGEEGGKKIWRFVAGTIAGDQDVRVPRAYDDDDSEIHYMSNDTGFALTLTAGSGATLPVPNGTSASFRIDTEGVSAL